MALLNSNQPVNSTPPSQRGFFSRLTGNKHSDAMQAYMIQQEARGTRASDISWGKVSPDDLKASYRKQYGRPFPG